MKKTFIVLRIVMALIFLWAFFDKLFGLGFATASEKAWIHGGSPTSGFLANATQGPFADVFKSLAGVPLVDWLFMLGLLFVGLTYLFNRYMKWGAVAGIAMMALMYLAVLPPENHPFLDDHIVYALVLGLLASRNKS
jgi:thiosulfate dehydrogenase (quinone) large subunit